MTPISSWINEIWFDKYFGNLQLPHLKGFILDKPDCKGSSETMVESIPAYMWYGVHHYEPPGQKDYRKKVARLYFGWNHEDWCHSEGFHIPYLPTKRDGKGYDFCHDRTISRKFCFCKVCGQKMAWRHDLFLSKLY